MPEGYKRVPPEDMTFPETTLNFMRACHRGRHADLDGEYMRTVAPIDREMIQDRIAGWVAMGVVLAALIVVAVGIGAGWISLP